MTNVKPNRFDPLVERLRAMAAATETSTTRPSYAALRLILREAAIRLEAAQPEAE